MLCDVSELLLLPNFISLFDVSFDYVYFLPELDPVNLLALLAPSIGSLDLVLEDLFG